MNYEAASLPKAEINRLARFLYFCLGEFTVLLRADGQSPHQDAHRNQPHRAGGNAYGDVAFEYTPFPDGTS